MKRLLLAGMVAMASVATATLFSDKASAGGDVSPYASGDIEIDRFYDALAPFGDWVSDPRYGYVWYPRSVNEDWRPFTVGSWIYTEEHGWYWDSPEPFAWAVYHYGRWGYDPEYAWYWVPGDEWAPAWVQWRYSDDYVGWAPEGPAPIAHGYGYDYGYAPPRSYAAASFAPVPDAWTFVRPRYLAEPAVRTYAVPRTSFSFVFSSTKYVYRPEYRHGGVYNAGMPRDHWSRVTHRRLEPYRLHRSAQWDGGYGNRYRAVDARGGRNVTVYAPRVKKGAGPRRAPTKVAQQPPRRKVAANQARGNAPARNVAPRYVAPATRPTPFERPAAVKPSYLQRKMLEEERRRPPLARPHQGGKPTQSAPKPASVKPVKPRSARPDQARRGPGRGPSDGDRAGHVQGAKPGSYDRRTASRNRGGATGAYAGRGPNARPEMRYGSNGSPHGRGDAARKPDGNGRHAVTPQSNPQSGPKPQANKPQAKKPQINTPEARKPDAKKPQAARPQAKKPQAKRPEPKKPQAGPAQAARPEARKVHAARAQGAPRQAPKPSAKKSSAKTAHARPSGPPRGDRSQAKRPQQTAARGASRPDSHAQNGQRNGGSAKKGGGTANRGQAKSGGHGGKCKAKPSECRNRG